MSNNIQGKLVVIAGAGGGLGEASARPDFQDVSNCALCRRGENYWLNTAAAVLRNLNVLDSRTADANRADDLPFGKHRETAGDRDNEPGPAASVIFLIRPISDFDTLCFTP
jgi:NAD(P)-dependent dehydrogenase (short-subunit alcohol dehydrogenase family)